MKPLIALAVTGSVAAFGVQADLDDVEPRQVTSEDVVTIENNDEDHQKNTETNPDSVEHGESVSADSDDRSETVAAPVPERSVVGAGNGSLLDDAIRLAAARHGVSAYILGRIAWCETNNRNIQSLIIDRNGQQENSWGYFQIHLDSHPEVSVGEALDPYYAADWAAVRVKRGEIWRWYGYNSALDRCN